MLVKELRDALSKMPGEISVHIPSGEGVMSVKHLFRMNLIGVEQFAEITICGGEPHTPDMEDALIERETGFKDRRELLDAYAALKKAKEEQDAQIAFASSLVDAPVTAPIFNGGE